MLFQVVSVERRFAGETFVAFLANVSPRFDQLNTLVTDHFLVQPDGLPSFILLPAVGPKALKVGPTVHRAPK